MMGTMVPAEIKVLKEDGRWVLRITDPQTMKSLGRKYRYKSDANDEAKFMGGMTFSRIITVWTEDFFDVKE